MKKILFVLAVALVCAGCSATDTVSGGENTYADTNRDTKIIVLNGDTATLDGKEVEQTDYTWRVDYTAVHDDVENAPAEYYTGTKSDADIYIDHELYYYPDFGLDNYELITYDGEKEYALYYRDGVNDGYIFATLPNLSKDVISTMLHTEDEAAENKVLHIKSGGTYILEGEWKGQINIEIPDDETVTLILNGINVECTVAPGIIFENAYECGGEYSDGFNTDNAGVTVVLNENTENTVTGCNVYRMLSTKYKNEETKVQKKVRKYDAAFYSKVTMNIEGDGVDSNGYIVIDGSTVNINGVFMPDSALDSDSGIYYTSGEIYIDGESADKEPGTYREISAARGFGKGDRDFPKGERPNTEGKEPPADAPKDFDGERPRRRLDENPSGENSDLTDKHSDKDDR